MCNPANVDMTHSEMQQYIWRKVALFADDARIELRLPNRKIADLFYEYKGIKIIVEIKTLLKESLFLDAYHKYSKHCDYLVMAGPPQLLIQDERAPLSVARHEHYRKIGIWFVDWNGVAEMRPAQRLRYGGRERELYLGPAASPCTVNGSPACTAIAR